MMQGNLRKVGRRTSKIINCSQFIANKSYTTSSDEYQYLETSQLSTMHFQKSLPRLPIPELDKTCEKYLKAQRPLLSDGQFERTTKIVERFKTGDGRKLHEQLKARDKVNRHTSYISGPWFDMYLKARVSNVLNFNPFMGFSDDPNPIYQDQALRATNMLISSLRMYKSFRAGSLSPNVFHLNPAKSDTKFFRNFVRFLPNSLAWYGAFLFKAFPLDMSQFKNLFNSTKIPGHGRDNFRVDENARHMLVIRNGHYYVFDGLDKNGNINPPEYYLACLKYILADKRPASDTSLGIMTAENRNKWASARDDLLSIGNEEQFRLIDTAIFALILDDEDYSKADEVTLGHAMLHGNADNRWFDKSFSLIIERGGQACINFEHAWGDGVAILRYFEDVYKDSINNHFVHPDTSHAAVDATQHVRNVVFNLDDKARANISAARVSYKELTDPLVLIAARYKEGLTKDVIKNKKLSPDSVIQLAFQMAFYKQYGHFPAVYESCSTAAFKHGRTETMRPCTILTKQFCEAVLSNDRRPNNDELISMLKKCSSNHSQLIKEASMGQGFDRHLFAVKNLATENMPEMFEDEAYKSIDHIILSTSTLSSNALKGAAFAPVVSDGFGLGYGFTDDTTGACISVYKGQRDGHGFKDALMSSFKELRDIISLKS